MQRQETFVILRTGIKMGNFLNYIWKLVDNWILTIFLPRLPYQMAQVHTNVKDTLSDGSGTHKCKRNWFLQ